MSRSSCVKSKARVEIPFSRPSFIFSANSFSFTESLSPDLIIRDKLLIFFSIVSKSLSCNSMSIISLSRIGFTFPST